MVRPSCRQTARKACTARALMPAEEPTVLGSAPRPGKQEQLEKPQEHESHRRHATVYRPARTGAPRRRPRARIAWANGIGGTRPPKKGGRTYDRGRLDPHALSGRRSTGTKAPGAAPASDERRSRHAHSAGSRGIAEPAVADTQRAAVTAAGDAHARPALGVRALAGSAAAASTVIARAGRAHADAGAGALAAAHARGIGHTRADASGRGHASAGARASSRIVHADS